MGIYSEETKKHIVIDVAAYKAKQKELRDKLGEALNGFPDNMIYSALLSTLHYGFKMPNGQWHPSPNKNSDQVITEGKPVNVDS